MCIYIYTKPPRIRKRLFLFKQLRVWDVALHPKKTAALLRSLDKPACWWAKEVCARKEKKKKEKCVYGCPLMAKVLGLSGVGVGGCLFPERFISGIFIQQRALMAFAYFAASSPRLCFFFFHLGGGGDIIFITHTPLMIKIKNWPVYTSLHGSKDGLVHIIQKSVLWQQWKAISIVSFVLSQLIPIPHNAFFRQQVGGVTLIPRAVR